MVKNIESFELSVKPDSYNNIALVRINFKFPCTYTFLSLDDLKEILRLWISGEELKYPLSKFQGRFMLLEEIIKIFLEGSK